MRVLCSGCRFRRPQNDRWVAGLTWLMTWDMFMVAASHLQQAEQAVNR